MKVLITGGAGFIGSHLSKRLHDEGHDVTVLDNLSPQIHGTEGTSATIEELKDITTFIVGDIRDTDLLKQIMPGIEVVVCLAAETGTGESMYRIKKYADTNIGGMASILEAITGEGSTVHTVVLASSRAVYGEGQYRCAVDGIVYPDTRSEEDLQAGRFDFSCPKCGKPIEPMPTQETAELKPKSIYAISKQTQEQMVSLICGLHGIKSILFRYQNVYGPGQSLQNPYTGIFSIFSTALRSGHEIHIFEDGKESRDFVYIDDVVEATATAVNGQMEDGIYNVGSGVSTPVETIVAILKKEYDSSSPVRVSGNYRAGDVRHAMADTSKLEQATGFRARTTIEDGIRTYVQWVKGTVLPEDRYEASLDELRNAHLFTE